MTKLTDTQLVVLSAAAGREDGSIHPLPASLKGGAADKVVDALIRKGLVERIVDDRPAVDDIFKITRAGLMAINADPDECAFVATEARETETRPKARKASTKRTSPRRAASAPGSERPRTRKGTKQAVLIDMLRRDEGATIAQIVEAIGWQPHTVRGAISGALKKKLGLTVTSEKVEGGERVYRIPA